MNKFKHFLIVIPLVFLSTAVTYMLISGQFIGFGLLELPTAASSQAAIIDDLIQGHFVLIAFLFSVIVVPVAYILVVFRRKEGDDTDGAHIHSNTALELAWTFIPLVFVVVFAVWGVQAYSQVIAEQENEQTYYLQAYKWDWAFFYPDLDNYYNEDLYVPVGQPVRLVMQSALWDFVGFCHSFDKLRTGLSEAKNPNRSGMLHFSLP
jgi:heme/copper-type cytochrome/quinol oxidase subunit 2